MNEEQITSLLDALWDIAKYLSMIERQLHRSEQSKLWEEEEKRAEKRSLHSLE